MSSSKKNYPYRDFAAGVYLSEAPSPPMSPYPPLHTVQYTCIQYTYSHREGGGGLTMEGFYGQQFTKLEPTV